MSAESPQNEEKKSPIQELASKSWNLELIISGAAIVLTTYLPDLVDDSLYFQLQYFEFLSKKNAFSSLPLLAYGFFKVISWLLFAGFIIHLIMRAFWVGMVGLHASYPKGIQYDKLPNVSEASKDFYREKYGLLEDYIIRIDKLCNQVFAIVFLIALVSFGVGLMYHILFWSLHLMRSFLPTSVVQVIYGVILIGILLFSFTVLWLNYKVKKSAEASEKYGQKLARLSVGMSHGFTPFVGRAMGMLSFTFVSNVPPRRYYIATAVVGLGVFLGAMYQFLAFTTDKKNRNLLEVREYYAMGDGGQTLKAKFYDNLRNKPNQVAEISLESDVVEGPFLKLFVAYPKTMDEGLAAFCGEINAPDSLRGAEKSRLVDSLQLHCLNRYFQVWINDSLFQIPEWVYHEKPGTLVKGIQSYIPTGKFKPGKNILRVRVPVTEKPDSLRVLATAPFWFAPG